MSELTTTSVVKDNVATQSPSSAPVLITEHQVLFGTAAAVPLPQRRQHVHAVGHAVSSAVTRWLTHAVRKPIRHDHPSRLTFLENSLMSREMDRL